MKNNKAVKEADEAAKMLNRTLEIQAEKEAEEKRPLYLYFKDTNVYGFKIEIPIIKKITPIVIDSIQPLLLSYRNMYREFLDQIASTGIKGLGSLSDYAKFIDDDSVTDEDFMKYIIEQADLFYKDLDEEIEPIYSDEDFELFRRFGYNKPQQNEDIRFNIEVLKKIIDTKALTFSSAKDYKNFLMSGPETEFWQNQDVSEVKRIVARFRRDNI